ncbi:MAG: DUF4364 family protein [Clostridiales bacterium]|jgi:DNA-binding PadR family transcriptional regulator|nr:DUF4364 family protein [Clostridiales bacterium]
MDLSGNTTVNKLILLFVFDKMEIPLTENTIIEMCSSRSTPWINYMECKQAMAQLLEAGFIYCPTSNANKENYYTITPDGRVCLAHFFIRIPTSLRGEITDYIRENRMNFRRKQEYFRDYYKNADGTYTVKLRIHDPVQTVLEIQLNVANRFIAKSVYQKWEEKAAAVYSLLHEQLIE